MKKKNPIITLVVLILGIIIYSGGLDGENKIIEIDSCDLSGDRESNVVVDIGMDTTFANRDYYAYTNKYSQLVYVEAGEIIEQNDEEEEYIEKADGRYCSDEAKVDGVESSTLDEGHVIADSLGGVSNAYNITPQESQLNRYGIQSELEEEMRNALYDGKSVTEFTATITYEDTKTQIPRDYYISYKVDGEEKEYMFENN